MHGACRYSISWFCSPLYFITSPSQVGFLCEFFLQHFWLIHKKNLMMTRSTSSFCLWSEHIHWNMHNALKKPSKFWKGGMTSIQKIGYIYVVYSSENFHPDKTSIHHGSWKNLRNFLLENIQYNVLYEMRICAWYININEKKKIKQNVVHLNSGLL